MINSSAYRIVATIYQSHKSLVCRAFRDEDGQSVILKSPAREAPSWDEIAAYRHEYQILQSLDLDGVIKAYGLEESGKKPVLVLEDFGGRSLADLMKDRRLPPSEVLPIALGVTEALAQIHRANVIHKDINPTNIILNPISREIKIIDFSLASTVSWEDSSAIDVRHLEGTLPYMSPEQTGRMNCPLDHRTDHYSLGVTLYELLCGRLPFEATDAMEVIHCHLARVPAPPADLNPEIPQVLSDIVMKLLSKEANDRYQSAWGIRADLEECLRQISEDGRSELFPLACRDIPGMLHLPQKIYGRESEMSSLMDAFERISHGSKEMTLVSGDPGIGKTFLVTEIREPVTRRGGRFVSGKFDQVVRESPYRALADALRALVQQLLSESDEELSRWREKIVAALGANGRAIADIIPELEIIVGPQPPLPDLGPIESQNRFNLALTGFLKVFCQEEHPLVLFVDDLQWIDPSSLRLLELVMGDGEIGHLLVVGAYRTAEVDPSHRLARTIDRMHSQGASVNRISLGPWNREQVLALIAGATRQDKDSLITPLAEVLLQKTGGNPFHVNEFLKSLSAEKLVTFDFENNCWKWDIEEIRSREIADSAVDLMAGKIMNLEPSIQLVLRMAACLGNRFRVAQLARVCEKSLPQVMVHLRHAGEQGLVLAQCGAARHVESAMSDGDDTELEFKFCHDRIQQAAYSLMPESDRLAIHTRVGKLLLEDAPASELDDRIFDVVAHLSLAAKSMESQQERDDLSRLILVAARRAGKSQAHDSSFDYLRTGIELLGDKGWQRDYDLTLAIHQDAVREAYLSGNLDATDELSQVVFQNARGLLDRMKTYETLIHSYVARNRLAEAVNMSVEVLGKLDVRLPKEPGKSHIMRGFLGIRMALARTRLDDLLNLPRMTDEYRLAASRILSLGAPAAYMARPNLLPIMVFESVKLSLRHGNTSASAHGYSGLGVILCGVTGDMDAGYSFGKLAVELVDRIQAPEHTCRPMFLFNYCVRHWKDHVRETLAPLVQAYEIGLANGDVEHAARARTGHYIISYLMGTFLPELEQQLAAWGVRLRQLKQEPLFNVTALFRQIALNLMEPSSASTTLMGKSFNEDEILPLFVESGDKSKIFYLSLAKLILCYLFGNCTEAVRNAAAADQNQGGVTGAYAISAFNFYDSLARLADFADQPVLERKARLKRVKANQKKMEKWANHAPMNFMNKYCLVRAEQSGVIGRDGEAADLYDQSIRLAGEHGFVHEEALANELAGRFYFRKGKATVAAAYMGEARRCYELWGAHAKVKHLDMTYPRLLSGVVSATSGIAEGLGQTIPRAVRGLEHGLELAAVMRASQALSSEISLAKLLDKLMKTVLEISGGQKGFLVLKSDEKLVVEAKRFASLQGDTSLPSLPLESCRELSTSVVNYVARSEEGIVLDDASRDGRFSNDSYMLEHRPVSILCVPLLHQGRFIGALYVENNLIRGAFTAEQVEILSLLCSQAAISLENARYCQKIENYSATLENVVAERTAELVQLNKQLLEEIDQRTVVETALRQNEQSLRAAVVEKEVLLRELHHRVKNNFAAITSLFRLQARRMRDDTLQEVLKEAESRVRSMALVHEILYRSESLAELDAGRYLSALVDELTAAYSEVGRRVAFQRDFGEVRLGVESAIPLGFVTSELVTNVMKHAFPAGQRGSAKVALRLLGDDQVELVVEDEGVGIPVEEDVDSGQSLGLFLVKGFIQQMKGTIEYRREHGTQAIVRFKRPQLARQAYLGSFSPETRPCEC